MKKIIALCTTGALLLSLAGCCCFPTKDKGDTDNKTTETGKDAVESASLAAVKEAIQADGKLMGVAFLDGIEGEADAAKNELFGRDYIKDIDFVKSITDYAVMDGWEMYCVVPADESVTITIHEYVFADVPYVGKELLSTNKPVLLRGNVSDIVPNLCIIATKGDQKVEYCPCLSGKDGRLSDLKNKVYDFTPYEYMPQFGGVDRLPDMVFCGDWFAFATDGNGEERTLHLSLNPDNSVQYYYGIGNSEILEDFEGTWRVDDNDQLILEMMGKPLAGSFVTEPYECNGTFAWEITAEGLTLTHVSGATLLFGTSGRTFHFEPSMG